MIQLRAQEGYELGAHVGFANYFGDLNTNYNLAELGFSFGIKARRNFNERVSVAAGFDYGQVGGNDINSNNVFQRTRNLNFNSNVFDFNATLEFNFFPYIHGSKEDYYTPYLFGGLSFMKFNPQTELDGVTYSLRDFGTEGQNFGQEYGLVTAAFVYGMGIKWDINREWSINASISGRNLFSDYIDDVSGQYPNLLDLEARRGITAVQLSNRALQPDFAQNNVQRGNGKNNDLVFFAQIGIMRYFGQIPCPSISKNQF